MIKKSNTRKTGFKKISTIITKVQDVVNDKLQNR